ncbi:transcriptional regulator [Bacteroidia bacterium]|nr:transcriptional regulator [Bacteroidia bacterium]
METLIATIAKGTEGYGVWIENFPGVYGQGDTVEAAKTNLKEGLDLYIKYNKDIPAILKNEYEWEYCFDVPSFLEYYSKIFSKSALERLTGINQTQFTHYVSGFRKPSKKTTKKLDGAIHNLANELNQIHFV